MLDHHPRLAVANDTHFIPRAIKDEPERIDPLLTTAQVESVLGYKRFRRLQLPESAVREAAASARTYGEFVTTLYTEYGRLRGKPLAGEKTPDYVRSLPRLYALFPWARTIHTIRDGRSVALSVLEWAQDGKKLSKLALWQEEPLAVCALWWSALVRAGRQDDSELGQERYREVRYETLVAQPEATLRELTAFLELPFAPEMLSYHEGRVRNEPGLSVKHAWLPPIQGLRDWRTEMGRRDVELFEALAGDLLAELGYEPGMDKISADTAAVAERARTWWESERTRRQAKATKRKQKLERAPSKERPG
jgi:hypothetical protein